MRIIKGLGIWFLFLLSVEVSAQNMVCAIPPAPKPITITQADGSVLRIVAKGNPFWHWTETVDGYTVVKNSKGLYEYARKENGKLLPSGIQAVDPEYGNRQARRQPPALEKHLKPDQDTQAFSHMSPDGAASNSRMDQSNIGMPSTGNLKVLCILIEYPDLKHTFTKEDFSRLMNGPAAGGGPSFSEFYSKSSFGKLNIRVDVTGWYKAKDPYATYSSSGKNSASTLVEEAVEAANKNNVDFSQYDNNKDGVVDGLIVVHAGPGGEEGASSQYIWSHMSYVTKQVDGVYVRPYCINPETRTNGYGNNGMVGVGIFAHEFGHLLGLPDLYDTDGGSEGIGEWGLMGSGNWLGAENYPAGFSAWSKEKMGWIQPKDITDEFKEFSLKAASDYPEAYKIRTSNPREYFLLENRQQTGLDSHLNGHGLAIWHINTKKTDKYPGSNTVNSDHENKGVDLEEADGNHDLDNGWNRSDNLDLFPADYYQMTLFDYSTDPSSDLAERFGNVQVTGVSISKIKETKEAVKFTYRKDSPDVGEDCGNPAVAIAGKNATPSIEYFFEYTMPKDGTLYVGIDDPELIVGGYVYRDCSDMNRGEGTEMYLDGSSQSERTFKLDFVRKGERLIFHWAYNISGDVSGVQNFDWNLSVETGGVSSSDSLALVAMYNKMGGKNWYSQNNWLKKAVPSWEGVSVEKGRVTGLVLSDLKGTFPEEFYNLTALKNINMQGYQKVSGVIDDRIASFKNLQTLRIDIQGVEAAFLDKLDGSMPELNSLDLNVSSITGELSANIHKMTKLENLSVYAESFSGKIPENIGNMPRLVNLTLSGGLSGSIPATLGKAAGLQLINLSFNKLTGSIPESLSQLNNLGYLNLQHNQLTAGIPAGLFNLPYLYYLYLDHNKLQSIPENFFSSHTLEYVDVSYNQIKGKLPNSASDERFVDLYAYLGNNQLTGTVPEALESISFAYLDLSRNQLEGKLPDISFVEGLDISFNRFSSMPDLTSDADEYYKALYCHHNHLSFDDFMPNLPVLMCQDCGYDDEASSDKYNQFRPQNPVDLNIVQGIGSGSAYTISLGIDNNIQNNEYKWFRDGKLLKTTKKNELVLENFSAEQAGNYTCEVSNAEFDNFTLTYEGIELSLNDNKQNQTISIAAVETKKYTDPAFRLKAESTGLKDIVFEVVEGPVKISGDSVRIDGTGRVKIRGYNKGNEKYNPAEAFVEFTIEKADQQISYQVPEGITYGQPDFLLDVEASSQLPVSLTVQEGAGAIELNGKSIAVVGAGMVKIQARQEGSSNFNPAKAVDIVFDIAKATQQLEVAQVEDQIFGAPAFALQAVSSQGLPVTLKALTDNISLEENIVTILKAGPARIEASQSGTSDIQAAQPAIIQFDVAKASQVLYFQQIEDKNTTDAPFELQAYSNQGLPVSYRVIDGEDHVRLNGNLVSIRSEGAVQIEAYQDGNENYEPAQPALQGFTILNENKATQTITLQAEIPDTVRVDESYLFVAKASSNLPPEIMVEGPAALEGEELVFTGAGKVKVIVRQSGNEEYNAAPTIVKEYTVLNTNEGKRVQSITYDGIEDKVYGDKPFTIEAAASSGLPLTYEIEGPASLSGDTITLTGAGEVLLTILQEGNKEYQSAEVAIRFVVARAAQQIDFRVLPLSDSSFLLQGNSTADLPLTYRITAGEGRIVKDTLYIAGTAMITVEAAQEGNQNFLPASPVSRTVDVSIITGVEKELLSLIRVYPNPSSSIFYLEAHDIVLHAPLRVYSAEGKQVYEKLWQGHLLEIDLTGKPEGIYFVRFQYQDQWYSMPVILKP